MILLSFYIKLLTCITTKKTHKSKIIKLKLQITYIIYETNRKGYEDNMNIRNLWILVVLGAFVNSFCGEVTLSFPDDNENLTDYACSFRAKVTGNGPYQLYVSREKDFSGEVIKRTALADREDKNKYVDVNGEVYFLSMIGHLEPSERWILETGVWYWKVTDDGGNSFSETRKLTVNDERPLTPMSYEISPRKPLFHLRLGRESLKNKSNPGAVLKAIIPDELRNNIVLDVGHSWQQFHHGENFYQFSKFYNDLGYQFSVDLGLASTLGRIVSPGEVEVMYRDLPNFVGGEIAEMFYKYRYHEVDNSQLYASFELSRKYGKFFLFGDMNWKYDKWQLFNNEFYEIFNDNQYNDYFLPVYKSTDPLGAYTCVSNLQGMKLTGMVNNIGIWSDMWTWEKFGQVDKIELDEWLENVHSSGIQKYFPYAENIKQFIYGITYGSTVFMVEPELQWDWDPKPNDLYYRYLYPFMAALAQENIIPSVESLNKYYKVIVDATAAKDEPISHMDGNIWGDYLTNTLGIGDIPGYDGVVKFGGSSDIKRSAYLEMIPNTDRYVAGIPFLPSPDAPAPVINGKPLEIVGISKLRTPEGAEANLNKYYPLSGNEAFAVRIDSSFFVFNTVENNDIVQNYKLDVNEIGIESMYGDIHLLNYIMARIRSDGETMFFQTNAHVYRDYDGGRYLLPTYKTEINFKCTSRPKITSTEINAITEEWNEATGILKITVDHENAGAVDFILGGDGTLPVEPVILPQAPGILEAEEFDTGGEGVAYHDADSDNLGNAYRTEEGVDIQSGDGNNYIIGYIADGEWLTYTFEVKQAGEYSISLNTSSPNDGGKVSLTIGSTKVADGVLIPKTGDWGTYDNVVVVESIELEAGKQTLRINIDKGNFNLDNIKFIAIDTTTDVVDVMLNNLNFRVKYQGDILDINTNINEDFRLYNVFGKSLMNVSRGQNNVSRLPAGLYFIKAKNKDALGYFTKTN